MPKRARTRPTCRWFVAVVAAATVMAACGSADRTDGQGPPCECPEFIELIDTIDWAAGQGTTNHADVYMVDDQAHVVFTVHPSSLDPREVAADLVQALTNEGLAVAERVRNDGTVAYDVSVDDGLLSIWPVPERQGGGGIGFWLRSAPTADALQPYVATLGLIEPTSN